MFKSKTVFIVGAGASAEIGLPTGAKLIEGMAPQLKFDLDEFSRPTRGDKALFEIIQRHTYSDNRHEYAINLKAHVFAAERISKGLNYAMSIDNFIDIHKDDYRIEFCGKLAIASNILKAERDSSLYVNPDKRHATFDVEKVKKTWFHRFVQILHTGVSVDDVGGIFDNISIITFNYDRCIEHFLLHALRDIYHLESGDTEKLLSGLRG
ncbi:hypothetical protein KHP60_16845 [Microvirga sp. 3-52]|uniref:hypothetical protein n=1 Tax=Microvirga sp. 3-52 TaxID=2792425 RepID=UPI001AC725C2|nr:hypothetical protein [Microvirga sp. 3-52]MBO1906800.1 hypothetical protein [Microvirga sp. 3-52]MBS7453999.1 hypothetical protein [Microvirga sp. 3-52]